MRPNTDLSGVRPNPIYVRQVFGGAAGGDRLDQLHENYLKIKVKLEAWLPGVDGTEIERRAWDLATQEK